MSKTCIIAIESFRCLHYLTLNQSATNTSELDDYLNEIIYY